MMDSEDTLSVVTDHCVFASPNYRRRLLKEYRKQYAHSIDSECDEMLTAMGNARYAVLLCECVSSGIAIQMRNLLTGDVTCLIDINLAETIQKDWTIASYIIAPHGMYMTTGAPLPIISKPAAKELTVIIQEYVSHGQNRLQRHQERLRRLRHPCDPRVASPWDYETHGIRIGR